MSQRFGRRISRGQEGVGYKLLKLYDTKTPLCESVIHMRRIVKSQQLAETFVVCNQQAPTYSTILG